GGSNRDSIPIHRSSAFLLRATLFDFGKLGLNLLRQLFKDSLAAVFGSVAPLLLRFGRDIIPPFFGVGELAADSFRVRIRVASP
ncbi:MAG: hypothetical protein ACR2NZ_25550, partial [Rubripirellula sp.]